MLGDFYGKVGYMTEAGVMSELGMGSVNYNRRRLLDKLDRLFPQV